MGAAWSVAGTPAVSASPLLRIVLEGGVVSAEQAAALARSASSSASSAQSPLDAARKHLARQYFAVALGSSLNPESRVAMRPLHRDRVFVAGGVVSGCVEFAVPRDRLPASASPAEATAKQVLAQTELLDGVGGIVLSMSGDARVDFEVAKGIVATSSRAFYHQREELYKTARDGPFSAVQRNSERHFQSPLRDTMTVASLPFQLKLPETLYPSTEFSKGYIRYTLQAAARYRGRTDVISKLVTAQALVGVMSLPNVALSSDSANADSSVRSVVVEASVGSYFGASGKLRAAVTLPKRTWTVNDTLSGDISLVLRAPHIEITDIRCTVLMHRSLVGQILAGEQYGSSKKTLVRSSFRPSQGEWAPTKDGKGRVALIPFALSLPSSVVHEFDARILAVTHTVRVEIFTNASDSCQCMAHVPIHILGERVVDVSSLAERRLDEKPVETTHNRRDFRAGVEIGAKILSAARARPAPDADVGTQPTTATQHSIAKDKLQSVVSTVKAQTETVRDDVKDQVRSATSDVKKSVADLVGSTKNQTASIREQLKGSAVAPVTFAVPKGVANLHPSTKEHEQFSSQYFKHVVDAAHNVQSAKDAVKKDMASGREKLKRFTVDPSEQKASVRASAGEIGSGVLTLFGKGKTAAFEPRKQHSGSARFIKATTTSYSDQRSMLRGMPSSALGQTESVLAVPASADAASVTKLKQVMKQTFGARRKVDALAKFIAARENSLNIEAEDVAGIVRELGHADFQSKALALLRPSMSSETISKLRTQVESLNVTAHGRKQLHNTLS